MEADTSLTSSPHLRKVLNFMFPQSYLELHHQPPNSPCTLLSTKCWTNQNISLEDEGQDCFHIEASTEPSSRANIVTLREHLNASLIEHQAKQFGLCPVRRAIFNQCFDELIRQVTVGCIEQGLLLFRVRNELQMTLNCYRKAYESGVNFGINKAIGAELELERSRSTIEQLEKFHQDIQTEFELKNRINRLELRNKLESVDKLKEYYNNEITRKDQIIEQQRSIIRALSQNFTNEIKSPTSS